MRNVPDPTTNLLINFYKHKRNGEKKWYALHMYINDTVIKTNDVLVGRSSNTHRNKPFKIYM